MDTQYALTSLTTVTSTQDEARARFSGLPVLVTAARQTKGRGRNRRVWENAPRAMAASLALDLDWPAAARPLLSLIAGLAARTALGGDLRLKWPNDVVDRRGDKVAGLLAEDDGQVAVVGCGANVWWPDPPSGYAALEAADPGAEAAARLAEAWAEDLLTRVRRGPEDWGRREYESACVTLGETVTWDPGGRGRATGIDPHGGLVVSYADGTSRVLRSGEVRHLRAATLSDLEAEELR